jgi:hypothetical protein
MRIHPALNWLVLLIVVLALTSLDAQALPGHCSTRLPRRGIGIYLIVSGIILALVWLVLSIVPALLAGTAPPEASYYTTFIMGAVDVGIIAPALMLAGGLLLQRAPVGYLLAAMMLVFTAVLGTSLTAAGMAQLWAGLVTIGQFIGFTAGFSLLTLFALGFTIGLFRAFSEPAIARPATRQAARA